MNFLRINGKVVPPCLENLPVKPSKEKMMMRMVSGRRRKPMESDGDSDDSKGSRDEAMPSARSSGADSDAEQNSSAKKKRIISSSDSD